MFVDKQAEFSNSQAITVTALSTNTYDNGTSRNTLINHGDVPQGAFLVFQVDTALTGGTSLTISLESDSLPSLAVSPTVHYTSGALLPAVLVAGMTLIIPLPVGNYEQHLGIRYTVVGTFGAGAVSAFITTSPQTWRPYANAT